MKPTPEQVAAAKAYPRETEAQWETLKGYSKDHVRKNVESILLAALEAAEDIINRTQAVLPTDNLAKHTPEWLPTVMAASLKALDATLAALKAAEADSARLDWLEKEAVDLSYIQRITLNETDAPLGPVFVAWGGDGNLRAVVDAARKEDRT